MKSYKQLIEEFGNKIKKLQSMCKHKKLAGWTDGFYWVKLLLEKM